MPARPALVAIALSTALALAGCGTDASSSSSTVAIKAGDTSCAVAKTSFDPGTVVFDVENVGRDTTEVYVYGKGAGGDYDKVVGEVENIAPGTRRDVAVTVGGGTYEVACKPGQKGNGVRTEITVSGAATGTRAPAYDREVEVTATDFAFAGLAGFTAKAGEKVEFKLANAGTAQAHEFEVFGPDGKVLGEVGPTEPGKDGEVVLELKTKGPYRFLCGIDDHESRGMKGTFTVS